ncbi:MAG: carbon-nitrogen hydrolase family protein [Kiloniellales bacterium]|nr:carbon-nitrogen hydrolase family protein [Kiloniellales bacterium]
MTAPFRAACLQLTSGREPAANISAVQGLAREAKDAGAQLIMTPEVTDMLEPRRVLAFEKALPEPDHQGLTALRALAQKLDVWLLAGSLVVSVGPERLANRSFLIGPDGRVAASYDKIHMFDVAVADGQTYRESRAYRPGGQAVLAELPWGRLGMTICYDLRFPQLYRHLAQAGADFLSIPSAFTRVTGEAHWHVLLRARAIETGCYVFAPAQCGEHAEGRQTYGHSLIVDPWGEVLADGGDEPGVVVAEIDPAAVAKARAMVPSLSNDRDFTFCSTEGEAPVAVEAEAGS